MDFPFPTVLNFVGTFYACLFIFYMPVKFIHSFISVIATKIRLKMNANTDI